MNTPTANNSGQSDRSAEDYVDRRIRELRSEIALAETRPVKAEREKINREIAGYVQQG